MVPPHPLRAEAGIRHCMDRMGTWRRSVRIDTLKALGGARCMSLHSRYVTRMDSVGSECSSGRAYMVHRYMISGWGRVGANGKQLADCSVSCTRCRK